VAADLDPGWCRRRIREAVRGCPAGERADAAAGSGCPGLVAVQAGREAGVGRDSYYRPPAAVARFTAARNIAGTPGTELARLREQVTALNRQIKDLNRDHAAQIIELDEQVKTYAGQIQVLALASHQLKQDNQRLRDQIEREHNVRQLHHGRGSADE
jgi:hypothetical protein